MVAAEFPNRLGKIDGFSWGVTRAQALQVLRDFIANRLGKFGDYQDAMIEGEPFMYHSLISFYLNTGLLLAQEVCEAAEDAYRAHQAPINAVEGFIRQILGWREFVRGIYWLKMPGYKTENFFGNRRNLPDFYWTGETDMACLKDAIGQTLDYGYAHHIQRLMVTGNFAMLAGIDPLKVHEWYLSVYLDAFEWVELPNTLGMSQFGDGGILGSKPYAASGNYINKMSNYCKNCRYNVKTKVDKNSCPFNSLYWHFLDRNAKLLSANPRMSMIYRNLDRMDKVQKDAIMRRANDILNSLVPSHADDYV